MAPLTLWSTLKLPSGFQIPLLGLGVGQNDECKPACLAALAHSYRHIDSAQMYRNEAQVGEALRESGVPREEVYINAFVSFEDRRPPAWQKTLKVVDESLQNFQFSYIDFMLLHSPLSGKEARTEAWKALIEARNQGKLRSIGVSNYGVKHLLEIEAAGLEKPAVTQIELHPFCQHKEIVEYCDKHGIIVEAYTPLIRGGWNNTIIDVGKKYNKDPAQLLIRWSLQRGFIPLPKSARLELIVSNATIYDFEISAEDMATIDALDRGKDGAIVFLDDC